MLFSGLFRALNATRSLLSLSPDIPHNLLDIPRCLWLCRVPSSSFSCASGLGPSAAAAASLLKYPFPVYIYTVETASVRCKRLEAVPRPHSPPPSQRLLPDPRREAVFSPSRASPGGGAGAGWRRGASTCKTGGRGCSAAVTAVWCCSRWGRTRRAEVPRAWRLQPPPEQMSCQARLMES